MVRNARILVVDDDDGVRKVLRANLEKEGYFVETAETGMEALRKLLSSFYNLALIDIKLGDIEGIDLLEMINKRYPKMIKIMVTGFPTLENAIEAVNKGADGYILKPVKTDELLAKIIESLRKQKKEKNYDEEKVTQFIEKRVRELKTKSEREIDTMKKYYKPI